MTKDDIQYLRVGGESISATPIKVTVGSTNTENKHKVRLYGLKEIEISFSGLHADVIMIALALWFVWTMSFAAFSWFSSGPSLEEYASQQIHVEKMGKIISVQRERLFLGHGITTIECDSGSVRIRDALPTIKYGTRIQVETYWSDKKGESFKKVWLYYTAEFYDPY